MSGHVLVAFLLMLDPAVSVSKDDLRVLKLNLLNAETLENDPHSAMQIRQFGQSSSMSESSAGNNI